MKARSFLAIAAALTATYFAVGAYVLRFKLEQQLLPHTNSVQSPPAPILRRYGEPNLGCVLFFPGQHGNLTDYQRDLFPAFTSRGIAVLDVAYPGQDGTSGNPNIDAIQATAQRALDAAHSTCGERKVVVYGRSFGSMVAAYSIINHPQVGLILEAASPSLSSAVQTRLKSRWYLAPLTILPISSLLKHDFSLAQALRGSQPTPTVVFQGTSDAQTPISALQTGTGLEKLHIVAVLNGTHSNTFLLAKDQIVETAVLMLKGSAPN